MHQTVAVGLAASGFVALLASVETATRSWRIPAEDSRKIAHVGSALAAACLPAFMAFGSVIVLCVGFIAFMAVSRRIGLFPAVHDVDRSTLGEVYFPLGVALTAAAVPHFAPYAYGVLVMGVSDAAASIVGQRYGRRPYRVFNAAKSFEGSAVFWAATAVITVVALQLSEYSPPWTAGLSVGLASVLTAVEGVSGGGIDNAVLPVAGAALLALVT